MIKSMIFVQILYCHNTHRNEGKLNEWRTQGHPQSYPWSIVCVEVEATWQGGLMTEDEKSRIEISSSLGIMYL